MKTCLDCGESKPLTEFYFRKKENCYRGRCLDCMYARHRSYISNNLKAVRETKRKYSEDNAEAVRKRKKAYYSTEKGKETQRRANKKFYQANKTKWAAWAAVRNAKKKGLLNVPKECPGCGRSDLRIDAHHHLGYDEKHWLDIKWLCSACHELEHSGINITAGVK